MASPRHTSAEDRSAEPDAVTISTSILTEGLVRELAHQLTEAQSSRRLPVEGVYDPKKAAAKKARGRSGRRRRGAPEDAAAGGTQAFTSSDFHAAVAAAVRRIIGDSQQVVVIRHADPAVAPVISAVVEKVPGAVHARKQALTEKQIDALVDTYLPLDVLAPALPELEQSNAEAQARFLQRVPVLTAEQVADLAGHGSKNRSATASRWKTSGAIFAVRQGGRDLYPAFQFVEGGPHPTVKEILKALPEDMTAWQRAFWFFGGNSWLNGRKPMDCLDDRAAELRAACTQGEPWAG